MKFGSKRAIFGVIWGGLEGFGPCLGISHPTHPHLGEISQKKTVFFLAAPLTIDKPYHGVQKYLWIVFFNIALVSECTEGSLLSAKKVTEARTSITTNETMTAKKTVIKQKCCITAA